MTLGNPKSPWFRQSHQVLWAGVALLLAILGGVLFQQWRESVRLSAERIDAASKLDQASKRQEQLAADVAAYDELAEKYSNQKQQLIREIGDYSKQLELLKSKTDHLERAHSELERLEAALKKFRETQERFEAKLRELEKTVREGSNPA